MENTSEFYFLEKCSSQRYLPNDRISSLPSDVLLMVLSLLPLKDMAKTSILSTRWLNLWMDTPVLDFQLDVADCDRKILNCFVKWVNHVLRQHKGLYLKKFRICCNITAGFQEDVNRWLEFALSRKVEILELDFLPYSKFEVGRHKCVLNDWSFSSGGKASLDGSKSRVLQFDLRFLKSLLLKDVNVTCEAINFLLRNCPFLEQLEIFGSNMLVDLVISDPTLVLKYLRIKDCFRFKVLSISNFNLVSLDAEIDDLTLKDLPMLVELSIFGSVKDLRRTLSQSATRQLKSLRLNVCHVEDPMVLLSNLAQLTKLTRMVIEFSAFSEQSLIRFLSIIESCNPLEEFVLELDWFMPRRSSRPMFQVERCSGLSIKLFEFKGYYGRVSDIELIMRVAENAPGLEKIIIDTFDLEKRKRNLPPATSTEQEARRLALKQIEELRESNYIPPHVNVLIRELSNSRPVALE